MRAVLAVLVVLVPFAAFAHQPASPYGPAFNAYPFPVLRWPSDAYPPSYPYAYVPFPVLGPAGPAEGKGYNPFAMRPPFRHGPMPLPFDSQYPTPAELLRPNALMPSLAPPPRQGLGQ